MKNWMWMSASLMSFAAAHAEEAMPANTKASVFVLSGTILLILALVALIVAIIVISCLKAQLKTAHQQEDASAYIREDSLNLQIKEDRFLYQTEQRTKIEKDNKDE